MQQPLRMRPQVSQGRADGNRRTNGSSIPGGIFGNQHEFYSAGDTGDFLSRVEAAEMRDNQARSSFMPGTAQENRQWASDEYQHTLQRQRGTSVVFGDDSTQAAAKRPSASMYQTTNQQQQAQTEQMHKQALERHEEQILMQLMVDDHGMTEKEARHEIALYRKEQAQQQAPRARHQQQAPPPRGLQPNGHVANAYVAQQHLQPQQQQFQRAQQQQQQLMQMQQQRPQTAPPPPQQQFQPPPPQQRYHSPPPFVHDSYPEPPPQRAGRGQVGGRFPPNPHYNSPMDMAAGVARGNTSDPMGNNKMAGMPQVRAGGNRVNVSAVEGGIFAPGVWS